MRILICSLVAVLSLASFAQADITDWTCGPDGDGAITLNSTPGWAEAANGEYTMSMVSTQHWWPAHMVGDFTTNTPLDPIIWVRNTVYNDATVEPLVWSDYHINMTMSKSFSILAADTNPGWIVSNITQPTQVGSVWTGTVDYLKDTGSAIGVGGIGEFDLKISFLGSISFTQEQIPTPEPASLLLLGLGGLVLVRRR